MLGGGPSWFEKLPCENALRAVLVVHRGTFALAFFISKHFSEDFRFQLSTLCISVVSPSLMSVCLL